MHQRSSAQRSIPCSTLPLNTYNYIPVFLLLPNAQVDLESLVSWLARKERPEKRRSMRKELYFTESQILRVVLVGRDF